MDVAASLPPETERRLAPVRPHDRARCSSLDSTSSSADDYEVVFMEVKLGLTLKSDVAANASRTTVVASSVSGAQYSNFVHEGDVLLSVNGESVANLELSDVRFVLKMAPRPVRLRFRSSSRSTDSARARVIRSGQLETVGAGSSGLSVFDARYLIQSRDHRDAARDDADSQDAVLSESFGDADSTRTTENSSVVTDVTEMDDETSQQTRRSGAFWRRSFRRIESMDSSLGGLRASVVPPTPRVEVYIASPCKAAIRVCWRLHPKAQACHLQFSRDRAVKVWKSWGGRPQQAAENSLELATLIFGLDYGKSYVVRCRYEFASSYAPADWSTPSAPVLTTRAPRLNSFQAAQVRRR